MSSKENGKELSALIIAYARPKNLNNQVSTLYRAGVRRFFISIDGPANRKVEALQNSIKLQISQFDFPNSHFETRISPRNLGVALGVIKAIDWFFETNECGLILEDDLEISYNFAKVAELAIREIRKDPKCLLFGGFVVENFISNRDSFFLSQYPMIWGWATTREKWAIMRTLIVSPKKFQRKILFNERLQFWYVAAKRAELGFVDTWDSQLTYEFLSKGYRCLLPGRTCVRNIGFDEVAVHTKTKSDIFNVISFAEDYYSAHTRDVYPLDSTYEKKYERHVYQIRYRHIFSIYKLFIQVLLFSKPTSLAERLRDNN